jgi:hypothetical protein
MSLDAQLHALERCGIALNPGFALPDLLARCRERAYETAPFRRLLETLGGEANDPARSPLSNNIWRVQVGCIAGPGDYIRVARRMTVLAAADLPLTDISDEFDWLRGIAWLRFQLREQSFEWPARIQERWVDPRIFSRFATLLEEQETRKAFTHLALAGQDVLLGCATPEQFAELRRVTGLGFAWLG